MFRSSRPLLSVLSSGVLLGSVMPLAVAQDEVVTAADTVNDMARIREEIDMMRADYESRIKTLEARLGQMEKQAEQARKLAAAKPAPAVVTPNSATASAGAKAGLGADGEVEPPHTPQEREALAGSTEFEDFTRGLEFHGYFRSGYGVNEDGEVMEAFQAPGSQAKYRLGNETETYLETAFDYYFPEIALPDGKDVMMSFRPAYVVSNATGNAETDLTLREAYGKATGLIASIPEASVWAGQRFYNRMDVHMNDFYYLDMSGFGGGFEGIDMGNGELQFAWIGGSIDTLTSNASERAETINNKNNLDIKWSEIDVLNGKGLVWLNLAHSDEQFLPDNVNVIVGKSFGAAGALGYEYPEFFGGYSRSLVQYGVGSAFNFRSTSSNFSGVADGFTVDEPLLVDLDDAWHFRFVQDVVIEPIDRFGLQGTFVWDEINGGIEDDPRQTWVSIGARPVYYFTDHFSLALEAGMDYVSAADRPSGSLYKTTLAAQLSPSPEYFSRPVLRAFVTWATWDEELKGFVAPRTQALSRDGFSAGVQVEAWW